MPGRLIRVKGEKQDFGWGVVVNFNKQKINPKLVQLGKEAKNKEFIDILTQNESHYILDVYLFVKNKLTSDNVLQPGNVRERNDGKLGIIPVVLSPQNIHSISSVEVNMPDNLKQQEKVQKFENTYFEVMRR